MENVKCKSCSASVEKNLEFCSSCGDWLGLKLEDINEKSSKNDELGNRTRVPQLKCSNCSTYNLPSVKNCKNCSQPLVKPLSSYGATALPSRKEVPGIRAVFFLTFLIPLIALASYFYNSNISEEIVEQVEIVQQSTTSSTTTTIQRILEKQLPKDCSASSSYKDGDGYSCKNLYDGSPSSWQDNSLKCADGWIEFNFSQEIYIEFLVFQNVEDSKSFARNFKARDITISTNDTNTLLNKELENDNTSQWVDINATTSYIRIDILSAFQGEEIGGSQPFEECAIQEITFYGRG